MPSTLAVAEKAVSYLFGEGALLTATRLSSRRFQNWLRAFVAIEGGVQALHPARAVGTQNLVGLLSAKAEGNEGGILLVEELAAFLRVILEPSANMQPESELAWVLFDVTAETRVAAADVERVFAVLATVGVTSDEVAQSELVRSVNEEDGGFLTAERFFAWCNAQGPGRAPRTPRHGAPAEVRPRSVLLPGSFSRPRDHCLRSADVGALGLAWPYRGDRLLDLSEPIRQPTPACSRRRKLPGAQGRRATTASTEGAVPLASGSMLQAITRPSAPAPRPALPNIDPDEQEKSWLRRKQRLVPHMRVKVIYNGPYGVKKEATGILRTGWGTRLGNEGPPTPHAQPPPNVRRAGAPGPTGASAESPPWQAEAARWADTSQFLVVEVLGGERLFPRAAVTPLV